MAKNFYCPSFSPFGHWVQWLQPSWLLLGGRSHSGVSLLGSFYFSEHQERLWAPVIDVCVTAGEANAKLMVISKAPLSHKGPSCSHREKSKQLMLKYRWLRVSHTPPVKMCCKERRDMSWGKQPSKVMLWSTVLSLVLEDNQDCLLGLARAHQ